MSNTQQHPPHLPLLWLAAAIAGPVSLTVTAYGVAEYGPQETVQVHPVSQKLETPTLISQIATTPLRQDEVIRNGDTLARMLSRLGVNDPAALAYLRWRDAAPAARGFFDLTPGRSIYAITQRDGQLIELGYLNAQNERLVLRHDGDSYSVSSTPVSLTRSTAYRSGTISGDASDAIKALELPANVRQQLGALFGEGQLSKGSRYSVIYETFEDDGQTVSTGRLLAASLNDGKQVRRAYWFQPQNQAGAYYNETGDSASARFTRYPTDFTHISSPFGLRMHPVLKRPIGHEGVDLAAPAGTPVYAAGNGKLVKYGREGAYGNMAEIRHDGRYQTVYAHMSKFASGLKAGSTVTKGQLIGYVGSTGRSTGPHLHFEFRINDQPVDPLAVKLPADAALGKNWLAAFKQHTTPLGEQLALLDGSRLASIR
ncbi:M23 family metallopeptidase [Jeongeupia naejangsanensis]|uniref:Peptidoglycan DD-metalloendopeptidase family protein n=1 Tax=Jeongeupia naejangsanensis TaxID=613195 RepID=A0ABS2BLK6_9NEIS|nr:peptidoglycan DD-metalloendopeptidase family protein [Jeongeupia naejangsanensis]MBM3115654.1 peptidoglycan DD-metalloendopeptidase family protein [Jeongeupia naejangsanensis]